jgi:hypothetical protein
MRGITTIVLLMLLVTGTGHSATTTTQVYVKPAAATDTTAPVAQRNMKLTDQGSSVTVPPLVTGRYFALIIGVQRYSDPNIRPLDYPLQDAQRLYDLLTTRYTFDKANVTFLPNPQRKDIMNAFDDLAEKVGETDNLLIFYAGHGYWDEKMRQGFWLPANSARKGRDEWLPNGTIRDYINGIKSKHTLLVTDACFSGGIFKTRDAFSGSSKAAQELYKLPSRKAMTSGAMKEVPDRSVFIEYLVKRLNENSANYLSSEQLFSSFREAVINNSPISQVPQFGEIRETGDEGGDFIFVRRQ